jgi:hypothetical protein
MEYQDMFMSQYPAAPPQRQFGCVFPFDFDPIHLAMVTKRLRTTSKRAGFEAFFILE